MLNQYLLGLDTDLDHFMDIHRKILKFHKICDLNPQKTQIHGSLLADIHEFLVHLLVNCGSFSPNLKTCTLNGLRALWIPYPCVQLQVHPGVHSCPAIVSIQLSVMYITFIPFMPYNESYSSEWLSMLSQGELKKAAIVEQTPFYLQY